MVTIVKNHADGLQKTYDSIFGQTFQNWEMLIVVGESTDSTLQLATSLARRDKRLRVLIQESSGIYAAMNLGLQDARGQFIYFMNAGDRFSTDSVLDGALKEILATPVGLVVGGYSVDREKKNDFILSRKLISELDFAFNRRSGCHQSMLFRTEVLTKTGGFDLRYSLASDFDSVLKVIRSSGALRVAEVYSLIEPGGVADQGIFKVHQEKHEIRRRFFKKATVTFLSWVWTVAASSKVFLSQYLSFRRIKTLLL
jgi:putative colanic acid biosynthesis glycosyltransferase